MGDSLVLGHEFLPLGCPKPVLLIDDSQSEVFELHRFLNEGVCAYEYRYLSLSHPLEELWTRDVCPVYPAFGGAIYLGWELSTASTSDQSDVYGHMFKVFYE